MSEAGSFACGAGAGAAVLEKAGQTTSSSMFVRVFVCVFVCVCVRKREPLIAFLSIVLELFIRHGSLFICHYSSVIIHHSLFIRH